MSDIVEVNEASEIVNSLIEGGFAQLLDDPEVCSYIKEGLKEAGCPPPFHLILFTAIKKITLIGSSFGGQALQSRLGALVKKSETLERFLTSISNICRECEDRNKLNEVMLAHLKGDAAPEVSPTLDRATEQSVLQALYFQKRFEQQDEMFALFAEEVQSALYARSGDEIAPQLGWSEGGEVTLADSIRYNSGLFEFKGREAEIDLLNSFCGDVSHAVGRNLFSWLLLTGPGGEGKTRLAHEFTRNRIPSNWLAGRILLDDLSSLNHGEWLPRQPTLIVIDYPAQEPKDVFRFLANLARRHRTFDWPVRVVLLERDAAGDWFETVFPQTSDGGAIRSHAFVHKGDVLLEGMQIAPIPERDVLDLMSSRFTRAGLRAPSKELLRMAARAADNRQIRGEHSPRPLFAAAITEIMVTEIGEDVSITEEWVDRFEQGTLLSDIIVRDRKMHWLPSANQDSELLKSHENLVALSTMAAGLNRSDLDTIDTDLRRFIPGGRPENYATINTGIVNSISGYEGGYIAPLEPDLIGEYFTIETLERLQEDFGTKVAAQFRHAAFEMGGDSAVEACGRIARDFHVKTEQFGWLLPQTSQDQFVSFAKILDRQLSAKGSEAEHERFHDFLVDELEVVELLRSSKLSDLIYWGQISKIGEGLRIAMSDGSLDASRFDLNELIGMASSPAIPEFPVAWDWISLEIKSRIERDPQQFQECTLISQANAVRLAVRRRDQALSRSTAKELQTLLKGVIVSSPEDLSGLLLLQGLRGELRALSISAAKAIARSVAAGHFPVSQLDFQMTIEARASLLAHCSEADVKKLLKLVEDRFDENTVASASRSTTTQLQFVLKSFSECKNFISAFKAYLSDNFIQIFELNLQRNIAEVASLLRLAQVEMADLDLDLEGLFEKYEAELSEQIEHSGLPQISFAFRYGPPELTDFVTKRLDASAWAKRLPVEEVNYSWAPDLAFSLISRGSISFGQGLGEIVAKRRSFEDLKSPPWVPSHSKSQSPSNTLSSIWKIAAACSSDASAKAYLDSMVLVLRKACINDGIADLARCLGGIQSINVDLFDLVDWQPTLIGRIRNVILNSQDAQSDAEVTDFVRLLGVVTHLLGADGFSDLLPGYVENFSAGDSVSIAVLPHRSGAKAVEAYQRQYWLGLKCLDDFGGKAVNFEKNLISETLDLWHGNLARTSHPSILQADQEMVRWLNSKLDQIG